MKLLRGLDFRQVALVVHRSGGKTVGYGLLLNKVTFVGVVRTSPRTRPARRHRLNKAERRKLAKESGA